MKDNKKKLASTTPLIALSAVTIICAFALGYMVKDLTSKEGGKSPSSLRDHEVEVVLKDGTTLGARLRSLEQSIGRSNAETFRALKQDIRQMALDRRVIDISADMPVQLFEIRELDRFPARGRDDAVVTLIEFSDFQCPYCSRMALYLEDLFEKHPDQIRIIFVDRPLTSIHPFAQLAHEAAAEAGEQSKFWEMFVHIFKSQKTIFPTVRGRTKEEYEQGRAEIIKNLVKAAEELGLDKDKMKQSLENGTHKGKVDANNELAKSLNINSTPTVYIDSFFLLRDPGVVPVLLNKSISLE